MKKSLWDNSNLQKEIKWDNIPVKGVTDEELHYEAEKDLTKNISEGFL